MDADDLVRNLEKEAYYSVIRAFKAQSNDLSWEKVDVMIDLRKELRVSHDEHSEFLERARNDGVIQRIREFRQTGQHQAPALLPNPIQDVGTSSRFPVFQKELRTSDPLPDLSVPSTVTHPPSVTTSVQPSSSSGSLERMARLSSVLIRNIQQRQHSSSGGVTPHETTSLGAEVLGRKVYTRMPDENKFYEAVISQFSPLDGRHCLVYDSNTKNETYEWADLKKIPPEDIRWAEEEPGISRQGVDTDQGSGSSSLLASRNHQNRDLEKGKALMVEDDTEILHAKKKLKEQEEAKENAIFRIPDTSNAEREGNQ